MTTSCHHILRMTGMRGRVYNIYTHFLSPKNVILDWVYMYTRCHSKEAKEFLDSIDQEVLATPIFRRFADDRWALSFRARRAQRNGISTCKHDI